MKACCTLQSTVVCVHTFENQSFPDSKIVFTLYYFYTYYSYYSYF